MSCKTALTILREAIDAKLPEDQRCKKTIAQMTEAVQNIEVGGGGVDVSGVTATAGDVLAGKNFVDADGTLTEGTIQTAAAATKSNNVVTIPAGYRAATEQVTVGTALPMTRYTPTGSMQIIIRNGFYTTGMQIIEAEPNLKPDNIRAGVTIYGKTGTFSQNTDATANDIRAGKWAVVQGEYVKGTLEAVDLSVVTAEAADIREGKVGVDSNGEPVYGTMKDGGKFYLCTGYEGVCNKIGIWSGKISDEMGEEVDLEGDYYIVDPAAFGTDRKWHCAKTNSGHSVAIGCIEIEVDWNDDGPVYEKKWAVYPGTYADEWSCWLIASNAGVESPINGGFLWQDANAVTVSYIQFAGSDKDAAPYGPTGWKGRPIVMNDKPVFFSYGAGVESANGFWEQKAGDGLAKQSEWQLVGGDSILKNRNNPASEYGSWGIVGNFPDGTRGDLYSAAGDSWLEVNIKHPSQFSWQGSSYTNPPPTFVYSETGGYSPSETVVSGLTFTGKVPEIGGFYNADATIKAERFFPA